MLIIMNIANNGGGTHSNRSWVSVEMKRWVEKNGER